MTLPRLIVEVGLGVGSTSGPYLLLDDTSAGLLDTGTLGPDLIWTDITSYVRGARISSPQRDRTISAYNAGNLAILLRDTDARFDPTNTSSPYYVGGVSTLTPNRPIRVSAIYNSITYPLWYGYVDRWEPSGNSRTNDQWTTVTATDGFKLLGRSNPTAGPSVGSGELSGARVSRLLNSAGWSGSLRSITAGISPLQATNLSANTLSELHLTSASEQGALFIDASGVLTFADRYSQIVGPRSATSQATYSDATGTGLPIVDATIATDDELLINQVSLSRVGGTAQTVSDPSSIAAYSGDVASGWGRTDLLNTTDAEVLGMARWLLDRYKTPENRFTSLTIKGEGAPATLWPELLDTRLRDRVSAVWKRRGGTTFSQDVFVEGYAHEISIEDSGRTDWTTVLSVIPTSGYSGFILFDDTSTALLDTGKLAY